MPTSPRHITHDQVARLASSAMDELRSLVSRFRTQDVVGQFLMFCLQRANDLQFDGGLVSPARQGDVLLSVLLSTPEPTRGSEFTSNHWDQIRDALNEAFCAYEGLTWSVKPRDKATLPPAVQKLLQNLAVPMFLHLTNTGLLASPAQVRRRIQSYLSPFAAAFQKAGRLAPDRALTIADWVARQIHSTLEGWYDAQDAFADDPSEATFRRMIEFGNGIGIVARSALEAEFAEDGELYWNNYSVGRGEAPHMQYPTEDAVAAVRPLVRLDPDRAMIPSVNTLWTAILTTGETLLSSSETRTRYFTHRDRTLEQNTAKQFARLLSSSATVIVGAFDGPDSTGEHDLVAIDGDTVFIVESKATPPPKAFRDPVRGLARIKSSFASDGGIQKAFEQGERLRARLADGEPVVLYDRRGRPAYTFGDRQVASSYSVVVTRDNFGILATDLSLLLERSDNAPYPWVINILDLEAIADAWEYLRWGTAELREYLEPRSKLHGKALSADELEIVGYHLQHGSLWSIVEAAADYFHLNASYSDFFDQLYQYRDLGGDPPIRRGSADAVILDLGQSLRRGGPTFVDFDGNELPDPEGKRSNSD